MGCVQSCLAALCLLAGCDQLFVYQSNERVSEAGPPLDAVADRASDRASDHASDHEANDDGPIVLDAVIEGGDGFPVLESWSNVASAGTVLRAVWGASENDLFIVGESGTILRFDGINLQPMTSNTNVTLRGVWGTSANNVYAVGHQGTILHFNGYAWSAVSAPTGERFLAGIWGSAADDIFVVGDDGLILHCCAEGWAPMATPTTNGLSAVAGTNSNSVLAVGGPYGAPTALYYDGQSWTEYPPPAALFILYGAWGTGNTLYACGHGLARFDPATTSWQLIGKSVNALLAMSGAAVDDIVVVGVNSVIWHSNGVGVIELAVGLSTYVERYGIWGSPSGRYFTVGLGGNLWQYSP